MPNSFKRCPTHFSRGRKNFLGAAAPPLRPPRYGSGFEQKKTRNPSFSSLWSPTNISFNFCDHHFIGKVFTNIFYVESLFPTVVALTNHCADGAEQPPQNKLSILISYVSAEIYELIEDCTSYDDAKAKLEETLNKTPNAIFARHQLTTRKQEVGESLEDFCQGRNDGGKGVQFPGRRISAVGAK